MEDESKQAIRRNWMMVLLILVLIIGTTPVVFYLTRKYNETEVQSKFEQVNLRIEELNTHVAELNAKITSLESDNSTIRQKVEIMNASLNVILQNLPRGGAPR